MQMRLLRVTRVQMLRSPRPSFRRWRPLQPVSALSTSSALPERRVLGGRELGIAHGDTRYDARVPGRERRVLHIRFGPVNVGVPRENERRLKRGPSGDGPLCPRDLSPVPGRLKWARTWTTRLKLKWTTRAVLSEPTSPQPMPDQVGFSVCNG